VVEIGLYSFELGTPFQSLRIFSETQCSRPNCRSVITSTHVCTNINLLQLITGEDVGVVFLTHITQTLRFKGQYKYNHEYLVYYLRQSKVQAYKKTLEVCDKQQSRSVMLAFDKCVFLSYVKPTLPFLSAVMHARTILVPLHGADLHGNSSTINKALAENLIVVGLVAARALLMRYHGEQRHCLNYCQVANSNEPVIHRSLRTYTLSQYKNSLADVSNTEWNLFKTTHVPLPEIL